MKVIIRAIGMGALALWAGYSMASPPWGSGAERDAPIGGTCDAQPIQWVIGRHSTPIMIEIARIQSGARWVDVRYEWMFYPQVVLPDDPQRLNIKVGRNKRIVAVSCG